LLLIKGSTNVFLCPMYNYPLSQRISSQSPNFYYYSYTMNGYTFNDAAGNGHVAGCASTWVITAGSSLTRLKLTNIHRPSDKIMLAEEPVSNLPQDLPPPVAAISPNDYPDDGRWLPTPSPPSVPLPQFTSSTETWSIFNRATSASNFGSSLVRKQVTAHFPYVPMTEGRGTPEDACLTWSRPINRPADDGTTRWSLRYEPRSEGGSRFYFTLPVQ